MPQVLNGRSTSADVFAEAVYVGRPTRWGNPFKLRRESQRAAVLARFEEWILTQPDLVAAVKRDLAGKDLWCWCAPRACHADVLLRIANADSPVAQ